MKAMLLTLCLLLCLKVVNAQNWVGLGFGTNLQNVRYKNTERSIDKDLKGLPAITVTLFFQRELGKPENELSLNKSLISVELGYKGGKIEDRTNRLLSTWTTHNLSGILTYRHIKNSTKKSNPFFGGGIAYDYLISGAQSQGFVQYDLTTFIGRSNISAIAETGITYRISEDLFAALSLAYLRGLTNVELDADQRAYLSSFKLSLSIFFKLS